MDLSSPRYLDSFYQVSELLTGFDVITLKGKGMALPYYCTLERNLGEEILKEFLNQWGPFRCNCYLMAKLPNDDSRNEFEQNRDILISKGEIYPVFKKTRGKEEKYDFRKPIRLNDNHSNNQLKRISDNTNSSYKYNLRDSEEASGKKLMRLIDEAVTSNKGYTQRKPKAIEEQKKLFKDNKLGPIAKNVIYMWYEGAWHELPEEWRKTYRDFELDPDHVISAESHKSGLIWTALEAHPMGANPPGFGSWRHPPK